MPKITVDGKTIDCKDRQMILQACIDAGIQLPQYCYHPGLSIPASCRICLVEVEGIPKLVPSCQTPVRDGMVVHSKSTKAIANQKQVMEYLLINHPLDCPVCDQAGECFLQDYSYEYGRSQIALRGRQGQEAQEGRRREHLSLQRSLHHVHALRALHARGLGHERVVCRWPRASRKRSTSFPGKPLNNKLAGNVVDLCPVGALLDKDFLFKQRVWLLEARAVDLAGRQRRREHLPRTQRRRRLSHQAALQRRRQHLVDQRRHALQLQSHQRSEAAERRRKTQYGTQVETDFASAIELAEHRTEARSTAKAATDRSTRCSRR